MMNSHYGIIEYDMSIFKLLDIYFICIISKLIIKIHHKFAALVVLVRFIKFILLALQMSIVHLLILFTLIFGTLHPSCLKLDSDITLALLRPTLSTPEFIFLNLTQILWLPSNCLLLMLELGTKLTLNLLRLALMENLGHLPSM